MTYLKEKYQYIFNITTSEGYIIYLSLFEYPKIFLKTMKIFEFLSKGYNIFGKDGKM